MPQRRSFKSDESFLEKISMGAIGTSRVFDDLKLRGHTPVELERGSMSFKIWKSIKIKRIRVPDLLCISCGTKIESRAKSQLKIAMSHSLADEERGWDHGLTERDRVAFVVCNKASEGPTDWTADDMVQYVTIEDMRAAQKSNYTRITKPKGGEEGYEITIEWPSSVAHFEGKITDVESDRLKYRRDSDRRTITVRLKQDNGNIKLTPLVRTGDRIKNNQIIASVVNVDREFRCSQSASLSVFLSKLDSTSLGERYASVKALAKFENDAALSNLEKKIADVDEHLYIRLEAASGLAKMGSPKGWEFIEQVIGGKYLQNKLEAVIVTSEINDGKSFDLLSRVLLNRQEDSGIRAGAAWGLGELQYKESLDVLISTFAEQPDEVRKEAALALSKMIRKYSEDSTDKLLISEKNRRDGIAWALADSKEVDIPKLLNELSDLDYRQWVAYILGSLDKTAIINEIEELKTKDPEIYFAATVFWKLATSWIRNIEEYR